MQANQTSNGGPKHNPSKLIAFYGNASKHSRTNTEVWAIIGKARKIQIGSKAKRFNFKNVKCFSNKFRGFKKENNQTNHRLTT
jgi:hypothetical protein